MKEWGQLCLSIAEQRYPGLTPTQFEAAVHAIVKRNHDNRQQVLPGVTLDLVARELEIELARRMGPRKGR